MAAKRLIFIFTAALLLHAADKKKTTVTSKGENEDLILTVTVANLPADVKEMVGDDLGGNFIVADVKVEPKYTKEVIVDRDDFQLRTDKDGEKSKPFTGSQIAGSGSLIISRTSGTNEARSPGWSTMGGPMVLGGGGGGIGAGSSVDTSGRTATMQNDEKVNPLKKLLDSRILPNGKTEKPVSGLLYFPMEKQKMKDLEVTFGGRENRITLRFKQ
jgi:hypothetical protein